MSDINHVFLVGRLTRDAELKYTNAGMAFSKFSIAVNKSIKRNEQWEDETNFFDLTLWGKRAEGLAPQLKKGKMFTFEGELRQNRWEADGQKHSKIEIIIVNLTPHNWHKSDEPVQPEGKEIPTADTIGDDDIPF